MDLNYLFHRQQVEQARAAASSSDEARAAHEQLARCYEVMIDEMTGPDYRFSDTDAVRSASPRR